jgi:hypothetical protein
MISDDARRREQGGDTASPEIEDFWCANETLCVSSTPLVFHTFYYGRPTGPRSARLMRTDTHNTYVVRRKNITIREDQAEWVEENHLNLSSFVRDQLDELIEEREN